MNKFKVTLLLCLVSTQTAFAWTKENRLDGLGVEILTGGVGQARLGSSGAVASNPALLAWIEKKQQFLSTNQVSFYGLKTEEGSSVDVSPDVTPLYAVTTEGFGNWGHGYGLTASDTKLAYFVEAADQTSGNGVQESQELGLNYALGYLLNPNLAIGVGIYASRLQEELNSTALGEEVGKKFVVSINEKSSVWVQGFSLGLAGQWRGWDYGLSSKFSTITYQAEKTSLTTGYIEQGNITYRRKEKTTPPVDMVTAISGGVRRKYKELSFLLDIDWLPASYDSEMEDDLLTQMMFAFGLEGHFNERYKWYGGYRYQTPGQGNTGSNTVSIGASKKNEHSLNYAGLAFLKEGRKNGSHVLMLNFGTMFDY